MIKAFCFAYIAFLVGIGAQSVGHMPENTGPFPWYLPLELFAVLTIPAALGYLAGQEDERKA